MSDEFEEEEYLDDTNDPQWVEKIIKEDYTLIEDEEAVGFDEVFDTITSKIVDLTNHDHIMEEKVLNSLRKGELK